MKCTSYAIQIKMANFARSSHDSRRHFHNIFRNYCTTFIETKLYFGYILCKNTQTLSKLDKNTKIVTDPWLRYC